MMILLYVYTSKSKLLNKPGVFMHSCQILTKTANNFASMQSSLKVFISREYYTHSYMVWTNKRILLYFATYTLILCHLLEARCVIYTSVTRGSVNVVYNGKGFISYIKIVGK